MKSIVRKLFASAIGLAAIFVLSFAAPAQTLSGSAAKQDESVPSIYAQLSARFFQIPRPRSCFCDEDCFAAMLDREREQQRQQRLRLTLPWRSFNLNKENEIRVVDLDGLKKVLQPDAKEPRPLLINFWATWCDPCREEFPDLVKLDADYRAKGLNFVAVSLDDISDIKTKVHEFLKEMKAEMSVVLLNVNDPEPAIKSVDAAWDGQLPATFLYDKEGKVVFKYFGRIKPAELRAAIDKAIGTKQ